MGAEHIVGRHALRRRVEVLQGFSEGIEEFDLSRSCELGQSIGHVAVARDGDVHVVRAQVGAGHALDVFDGHRVKALEVGGVVIGGVAVALCVQGETCNGLRALEGQGEAAIEVVLDELQRAVGRRGLHHFPDFCQEFHEGAVRHFIPHAGRGAEASHELIGADGAAGAIGVALVLAKVLVQSAAEEATEHGVHHAHRHHIGVAGLEVDRKGDVDHALNGTGNGSEADAVALRRHRAGVALLGHLIGAPIAEVRLGLGLGFFRGDVADHDQVGHVGLPDLGVVVHQVLTGDGFHGLLIAALAVRVLQTVGHGAGEATGNLVGIRCAAGKAAQGLLALLLEFFFREGGVHQDVAHQLEQGLAVLHEAAAVHSESRRPEAGANAVHRFVDLRLGAGRGARAHQGARHGGVAGFFAFENGVDIEGQAVAHPGEFVVLDHDERQAVLELVDSVVAQHDFRCRSRGGCRGAVHLAVKEGRNEGQQGQQEGRNAVHCAFSFMKYRTTRRSWL